MASIVGTTTQSPTGVRAAIDTSRRQQRIAPADGIPLRAGFTQDGTVRKESEALLAYHKVDNREALVAKSISAQRKSKLSLGAGIGLGAAAGLCALGSAGIVGGVLGTAALVCVWRWNEESHRARVLQIGLQGFDVARQLEKKLQEFRTATSADAPHLPSVAADETTTGAAQAVSEPNMARRSTVTLSDADQEFITRFADLRESLRARFGYDGIRRIGKRGTKFCVALRHLSEAERSIGLGLRKEDVVVFSVSQGKIYRDGQSQPVSFTQFEHTAKDAVILWFANRGHGVVDQEGERRHIEIRDYYNRRGRTIVLEQKPKRGWTLNEAPVTRDAALSLLHTNDKARLKLGEGVQAEVSLRKQLLNFHCVTDEQRALHVRRPGGKTERLYVNADMASTDWKRELLVRRVQLHEIYYLATVLKDHGKHEVEFTRAQDGAALEPNDGFAFRITSPSQPTRGFKVSSQPLPNVGPGEHYAQETTASVGQHAVPTLEFVIEFLRRECRESGVTWV